MGLLDWMRNRNARQQAFVAEKSQETKPETAKQMYAREAIEEKANRIAPTPEQEAKARTIGEELRKATQHREGNAAAHSQTSADGAGGNSAQRQKQSNHEKAQEALSPTDSGAGKTAGHDLQKTPEKQSAPKQQAVARPRPSWER